MDYSKEKCSCTNCGKEISSEFCPACGQKHLRGDWKSIGQLIGHFFTNLFFVDNRFFRSVRKLLFAPAELSKAYLEGQHKKYLAPISLFLFANLLFFLFNPMRDYYLNLQDQTHLQPYSQLAYELVANKVNSRGIEYSEYEEAYNISTPQISKLFMILNIPLMAIFIFPFIRKSWKYYYDSLIISMHYFTYFLLGTISVQLIIKLAERLGIPNFLFIAQLSLLAVILVYSFLMAKKLIKRNLFVQILIALVFVLSLPFSQFFYRGLIFFLTYLAT